MKVSTTALAAVVLALSTLGCDKPDAATPGKRDGADPKVTSLGSIEVTARLVEVPEGAVVRRELYDYATVLKYEVLTIHRGSLPTKFIYVGHYNPFKPRSEAADRKVKHVGGDVRAFHAGDLHRIALDGLLDDRFMGGVVNKYFGVADAGTVHWAVWTNDVDP